MRGGEGGGLRREERRRWEEGGWRGEGGNVLHPPGPFAQVSAHERANTCLHIPSCGKRIATWNTHGFIGAASSVQVRRKKKVSLVENNACNHDIICLEETHGCEECMVTLDADSPIGFSLVRSISNNHSPCGCIIMVRKNVVSDGMAIQREAFSDSRDHVVSFRTDNSFLAVFSANFVPDGSIAQIKEEITTRTRVVAQISRRVVYSHWRHQHRGA